jgi:hypothetical protein
MDFFYSRSAHILTFDGVHSVGDRKDAPQNITFTTTTDNRDPGMPVVCDEVSQY